MKHITLLFSILLFSTSAMAQDIDPFDVDMKRPIDTPTADTTNKKVKSTANKKDNTTDTKDKKSTPVKKDKNGGTVILDNVTIEKDGSATEVDSRIVVPADNKTAPLKKATDNKSVVADNKTASNKNTDIATDNLTVSSNNGTTTTNNVTTVLNDNGTTTTTKVTTISSGNGTTTTTTTTTAATVVADNISVSSGTGSSDNATASANKESFFSGKPFTGLDGKQIFYVMVTGGYSSSDGRGEFNSYPGVLIGATVGKQFFKYFAAEGFIGYNSAYFQSIELRGYALLQRVIRLSNNKYVIPSIGIGVSLATSQSSSGGTGVNDSDIGLSGKVGVRFIMGRVMFGASVDYTGRFIVHSSFSVLAEVGLIF